MEPTNNGESGRIRDVKTALQQYGIFGLRAIDSILPADYQKDRVLRDENGRLKGPKEADAMLVVDNTRHYAGNLSAPAPPTTSDPTELLKGLRQGFVAQYGHPKLIIKALEWELQKQGNMEYMPSAMNWLSIFYGIKSQDIQNIIQDLPTLQSPLENHAYILNPLGQKAFLNI